jgi:hypothetical protein
MKSLPTLLEMLYQDLGDSDILPEALANCDDIFALLESFTEDDDKNKVCNL